MTDICAFNASVSIMLFAGRREIGAVVLNSLGVRYVLVTQDGVKTKKPDFEEGLVP